jgi:DNA-binding SARP family transcriptional activator
MIHGQAGVGGMMLVRTLGTAEICVGPTRVLPTSPRKFSLLLYLAAERGRPIARSVLQDLIFPDQTEKNGRHSLRELVYRLRQAGFPLTSDVQGIHVDAALVTSDLDVLLAATPPDDDQLRQIERGFLPGYAPEHSEGFVEWLDGFRARSTFDACKSLVVEIGQSRAVGDWSRTELAARACLALDPLSETATLAMAEVLAVSGAKNRAIDLLDSYVGEIGHRTRELRIAPSMLRRRIGERSQGYPSTSGSLSPFVGREREMRILHEQMALARQGNGRCVAVVGEAGIGKTRLVTEFCQLLGFDGVGVASTAAQPHDVHRPFGAFADLFPRLMGMPGALGISPDSMSLLQRMVSRPSSESPAFADAIRDGDSFSHAITHAIIDLVDAITNETPLILAFDDIPALDQASLRLLGFLASGSKRRRLCILVTGRDLLALSPIPAAQLTTIELYGVARTAAARFVVAYAERESLDLDPDMAEWVQDASAGHPLFLESLLAHYANTRERFAIPPSLSTLLQQRLNSLSDHASVALQTCAILGKFAMLDVIMEATQMPRFELIRAVRELELLRLVRADGQQIRPIHALVSDGILERMTPLERRLAHQCAAMALESSLGADHSAALVWESAEHWYASGDTHRALAAIQRCASHAVEIGRPDGAVQMLERALTLNLSAAARIEIAQRLVAAGDAAMDSDAVLRAIGILKRVKPASPHDDLEFIEIRARTRIYRDGLGQENQLMHCVSDSAAPGDHRIRAATLLLKYADSVQDRDLALRAIATLPDSIVGAAEELLRLEYLMIAKSVLHEFDAAADLARKLLKAAEGERTVTRLHLSLNAIVALYNAGSVEEAVAIAEGRLAEPCEMEAPNLRLLLAIFLSEYFSDAYADERSASWRAAMDDIVEAFPTLVSQFPHRLSRLNAALAKSDLPAARLAFEEMDRERLLEGGPIRDRWRRLALIRLAQMQAHATLDDDELQALMASARRGSVVGGICEAEAAAVCHSLLQANRNAEARTFIDSFVAEFRRSRAPVARCVSEAIRAILDGDRVRR